MRRPRSERIPIGTAGIWHVTSRCVRRERLLEIPGARAWLAESLAAWLDVLAVDLLGYALMGNHVHLILRTRPDVTKAWAVAEVRQRWAAHLAVTDGRPAPLSLAPKAGPWEAGDTAHARAELSHPGPMLKAVKEGLARRLNRQTGATGHVWEGRYQDVALIDAGGVLAALVYVDLNPLRAGLAQRPAESTFCSARHRRTPDLAAEDAALARRLQVLQGHPLLDNLGQPQGSWSWNSAQVADLTEATAQALRDPQAALPAWAEDLLPRLGIRRNAWTDRMAVGGTVTGNVLGSWNSRRQASPGSRMASDKSGWFLGASEDGG